MGQIKEYFIGFGLVISYLLGVFLSLRFNNIPLWILAVTLDLVIAWVVYSCDCSSRLKVYLWGFIILSILVPIISVSMNPIVIATYIGIFLVFILSFFVVIPRYAKGNVLGTTNGYAVVDVYDSFYAGIPKGIYAAKLKKGIKKGDRVLLEVHSKWGRRELVISRKL